jgi:outer membrane lipoprotein
MFALGSLTACSPKISKQLLHRAGAPVLFEELIGHPDVYKDRIVVLGGYILEVVNDPESSLIIVIQAPLGSQNKPKSKDLSKGRFIVRSDKFLDPEVYTIGRKLTAGGRVSGGREKPLGDRTYHYLVIEAEELYLWPEEKHHTRPYDPYFYHPWYYPGYPWYPW